MSIINRRSIILICALLASLALYVFTDARYAALLIILFLLLFACAVFCVLFTGKSLSVEIKCPPQAAKGERGKGIISFKKNGKMPILCCNLTAGITNLLTDQSRKEKHSFSIVGRKEKKVDVLLESDYCGCIQLDASDITISDPLRIFSRTLKDVKYISGRFGHTYIMPSGTEMYVSPEEINAYDMESYKYSTTSKGNDPADTFDIKSYDTGDSFKAIHWKLSSKVGDLMIREYGLPIENNLLLLVDKNIENMPAEKANKLAEYVTSLSSSLLDREVNHTIGWFNVLEGEFETVAAYGTESMWDGIMKFISSPFRKDAMSAIDRYIESETDKQFSGYIYVSENREDIDRLMTYGQVEIFNPEN